MHVGGIDVASIVQTQCQNEQRCELNVFCYFEVHEE